MIKVGQIRLTESSTIESWETHTSMISKMQNATRLRPYVVRSQNSFGQGVYDRHAGHWKTWNWYFLIHPVPPDLLNLRSWRRLVIIRDVRNPSFWRSGQMGASWQTTTLLMCNALFRRFFFFRLAFFNSASVLM